MAVGRKRNLGLYLFFITNRKAKHNGRCKVSVKALVNYLFPTEAHVVFKEALIKVFPPRDLENLCTARTDH